MSTLVHPKEQYCYRSAVRRGGGGPAAVRRLAAAASAAGAARILGFGADPVAEIRLVDYLPEPHGCTAEANVAGNRVRFRLNVPGRHWVINALAVLGTAFAAGCDLERAAAALAALDVLPGRGRRHELPWRSGTLTLIDESYNASPAAVLAAIEVLGATSPSVGGRRVAVLGEMLELGAAAEDFHRELATPLAAANVDRVFLFGDKVVALHEVLPAERRGGLWPSAEAAIPDLLNLLQPGDVVTVKGSHAMRTSRIVERLLAASASLET